MCQVALRGEVVQASNVMHTMNKRSFIDVCLLIALFSILVFVKGSLVLAVWNQTIAAAGDCGIARM